MNRIDVRYWIGLAIITLVLAVSAWIVFTFVFPDQYPRILPVFLAIVVLITAAGQVFLTRSLDKEPRKFNSWYMIYKAIKMLIIATFLFIYVILHKKNGISFLVSVFIIYLVFMFFESASLNRVVRKQS